jgi:hypothetical protein
MSALSATSVMTITPEEAYSKYNVSGLRETRRLQGKREDLANSEKVRCVLQASVNHSNTAVKTLDTLSSLQWEEYGTESKRQGLKKIQDARSKAADELSAAYKKTGIVVLANL